MDEREDCRLHIVNCKLKVGMGFSIDEGRIGRMKDACKNNLAGSHRQEGDFIPKK